MPRNLDTEHWNELGKTYARDFPGGPAYDAQVAALRAVLADEYPTPKRILEIGCGFGRITKVLRETFPDATILATDSSRDMLASADRYLELQTAPTDVEGGTILGKFDLNHDEPVRPPADLVVAAEVLMHREPGTQIKSDVLKLVAMTDRTLITVDWYEPGVADMPGNYQHDMPNLVRNAAIAAGRADFVECRCVEIPAARQAIYVLTFSAPADDVALGDATE